MGGSLPKQFLKIGDMPILAYSLRTYWSWDRRGRLVVVGNTDYLDKTEETAREYIEKLGISSESDAWKVVPGGASRHSSTLAGLNALRPYLNDNDVIFIHDAARPAIELNDLDRLADLFETNMECNIASLASIITDTLVRGTGLPGKNIERLNREEIYAVKTPQAMRASVLDQLLGVPESEEFTDLLSWGQAAGMDGFLVESGPNNIKLTTPVDLQHLELILTSRS